MDGAGGCGVASHEDARFWFLGWAKAGVPGVVGTSTCRRVMFNILGAPKEVG